MKYFLSMIAMILFFGGSSYAALTGSKTIGVDYPSLAAAIADLNLQGVGPGGVTFNLPANYTETFATPLAGYITTTTGSATNPIVFQKSGTGNNPVIMAAAGTGVMDALIAVVGSDYVTFDGINLIENPANTTPTTQMEWGYAIIRESNGNGSQYITIKNCNIALTAAYTATVGIYGCNHTATSTTPLVITDLNGTNSNIKIFNNTVNCYSGISLTGYNDLGGGTPTTLDQNNEIGKDGGNIITNVAGQGSNGYGIYASGQNNFKVANNTVTSTMGGTGSPSIYGMYMLNSYNANVEIYNNTVSIQYSGSGTASLYGIWCEMGGLGQYNTVNIYNNMVTGCTYPTLTSGTVRFMNFNNLGVTANVHDNTVSNNVVGSSSATATGAIYYLSCNKSSQVYGPLNLYNNVVTGNTRLQSVPATASTYFINAIGSGSKANVYNNSVTNNVITSLGSAYGINATLSIASMKLYDNTISGITLANGTFYGINLSTSSSNTFNEIFRNRIQNIQGDLAASIIHGIYSSTAGTGSFTYLYNNMVSDLRTPVALSATNPNITGINIQGADFVGVYNNSVYLNASSTAANFNTAAFFSVTSMNVLDLRNNIFVNTTTPMGTGVTSAIRFANSTLTKLSSSSNNNALYAGTPGLYNVLFYDGTNKDQTLPDYKVRMYPRESQSVSEMPPFVSLTPGSTDLHLQNVTATQCESAGTIIANPAVNADYDNNPRYPNAGYPVGSVTPFAPDMGADEFGGIPNDLTPPVITYIPLAPTANTSARALSVSITDGNGVPVSGPGLPMLYWKVNSGVYQGVQGVPVSGNNYSFTFGSGVSTGDVVSYYVVAQDNSANSNVVARPAPGAAGYSVNPPSCVTPPTTPDSYAIVASFSGVFHVGVGKTYATLSAAAADVNSKVLTGPVTLILDDATYPAETYPVSFNANAGSSPVNTLTIKPDAGVSPVFEAVVPTGIIDLNGIDYVIIDGSNNGTNSKNLTISNPNNLTNGSYALAFRNLGNTDPATNITIKNCILKAARLDQSSSTEAAIRFINSGGGYENCIIDNNIIHSAFTGVQIYGVATWKASNIQVTNNTIGSVIASEAISKWGVDVQYADNTLISNNEIMGPIDGSLNPAQSGVAVTFGATNTKIRNNEIHTFWRSADDGWGCYGVYLATDASTVTEISNNVIYDIHSGGSAAGPAITNTYGIFARNGGNFKILHNSINLTGAWLSTTFDGSSACIGLWQQVVGGNIEIRNNILRNSMTMMGGAPPFNARAYGIMISTDATMFSTINNNDYYIDGVNGAVGHLFTQQVYIVYPTLPEWQTYTGQEANSITVNPQFTSPTNLIPTTTSMPHAGSYVSLVPTDITGINRTNPPDVGAYEFTSNPMITTVAANPVANSTATLNGSANANNTTFSLFFDYGLTNSYGNSVAATPASVTGSTTGTMSFNATGLTPLTTYHFRARGVTSGGLIVYGNDMTFTTLPDPPTVVTTAATAITSGSATLNGTVNANTSNTSASFEYGLTTSYGTVVAATPGSVTGSTTTPIAANISGLLPNTTYHYRAIGTNVTGTGYGQDMTFTTTAVTATVVTNLPSNVLTTSAQLNGTVTANNAATTVSFEWGTTTSYGNSINATPASVNGLTATAVLANLSGLTINTTYHYRCVGVNMAGTAYGQDQVFTTNCVAPVVTINGPAAACAASTGNTYTTEAGNNNYNWTVSPGGTITAGSGTNSITVTWNTAGPQSVSVNYSNQFGCNANAPTVFNVTVNALPTPTVSGPATVCQFSTGNTYTTQTGMTGYVWTVSAGGTITAGSGTNSIQVTWNGSGAQTVSVNYANASGCVALAPAVYNVMVNPAPAPTITGNTDLCLNSGNYIYITEAGMNNYVWTVSAGGTITFGQGTNSIQVTWSAAGAQSVSVNYANANGCSAVSPTVLNVSVNPLPQAAGTITGTSSVCGGAMGVAYSVAPIPDAMTYVWILPSGATIASGTGTNNITVDFAANASSGDIIVYGNNLCGNGTSSPAFPVTVTQLPGDPGTIAGLTEICQGTSGVTYTVTPVLGATGYNWTVPSGATIVAGNNTNSITVDFGLTAVSGDVTVNATNTCGAGTTSNLAVTVYVIPDAPVITLDGAILSSSSATGNQWYHDGTPIPGANGQTYDATLSGSGWYWTVVTVNGCASDTSNNIYVLITGMTEHQTGNFKLYPVPNDGRFTFSMTSKSAQSVRLMVFNNVGVLVYEVNSIEVNGAIEKTIDMRPVASGFYTVVIETAEGRTIRKIVVNR